MLADFFAPANRMMTLLCIAALVLAGVLQYWMYRSCVRSWVRKLPLLVCAGAAVLFLILVFCIFPSNAWRALSLLFVVLFAVLLLIACTVGLMAAKHKQQKDQKDTPHT